MRTGTELLGHDRDALVPLAATLVARPPRVCVFVPLHSEVPWEVSIEHALACQTRYWGGHRNLVVPMFDGMTEDELFWRLVRQYDPDLVGLHAPTVGDLEEIAPRLYTTLIDRMRKQLAAAGVDENSAEAQVGQAREGLAWPSDALSDELLRALIQWVAPFHHGDHLRDVWVNGGHSVPHELLDTLKLRPLPERIVNSRIANNPIEQLVLTGITGRLLAGLVLDLQAKGVHVEQRAFGSLAEGASILWPPDSLASPAALPATGLAYRAGYGLGDEPILVVGDTPHDWLLYRGLHTLRPFVYWLPASKSSDEQFLLTLRRELGRAHRESGGGTVVLTVTDPQTVDQFLRSTLSNPVGLYGSSLEAGDWRDHLPRPRFGVVDPRSVRTTPLLHYGGLTGELPTPTPTVASDDDLLSGGWVVDADVRDWSPPRHARLGPIVLPSISASAHDQRAGSSGPTFFGLAAFVQIGLGIENAVSRPPLAPLPLIDAISRAIQDDGWTVRRSDKGAYAQSSADIFGGVEALAEALRDKRSRSIFHTYTKPEGSNVPGCFLKDTRRRYLSLEEAAEAVGSEAEDVVNALYDRGALTRGHVLKCQQCRATSFYSLTEDQRFTCRRCRNQQRATRATWLNDPEPVFRYELAEVIFQFLDNDGDIPLLAAFDFFTTEIGARDRRPLDLAFEVEIVSPDGTQSEHDIVAVWGADLWLGEATKKTNLGEREVDRVRRLREVAEILAARGVLLATTGTFSDLTRERIASVFQSWPRPETELLEGISLSAP